MNYQDIDNSPNVIDMRKARNVNELMGVLSRIKSSVATAASQTGKLKISRKIELGKTFEFKDVLDMLFRIERHRLELNVARGLGYAIAYDDKRSRFFSVLQLVEEMCTETRSKLLDYMDKVGMRLETDMYAAFATAMQKVMAGYEHASSYTLTMLSNQSLQRDYVFTDVPIDTGFIMPEFVVRLTMQWNPNAQYSYALSFPDAPLFDDSNLFWFNDVKQLRDIIASNLGLSQLRKKIKLPKSVLRIDGVAEVVAQDTTLTVKLETGLLPKDIQNILSGLLPIVQRAVGASRFDVLHRVSYDGNARSIQFILAGRKIVDGQQAIALRRALAMSRNTYESICKALNHARTTEKPTRRRAA